MADSRVEKWRGWIEGPIREEVLTMNLHRDVYQRVGKIIEKAQLPPSYYWQFMRETYSTTQAMGDTPPSRPRFAGGFASQASP